MRHEFRLADIGEGLEEAEIIRWLVTVGDHVTRDQPLIEVMTDKSNAELPAPEAGIVVELGGDVGEMILVGELIAVIDSAVIDSAGVEPHNQSPAVRPHVGSPAEGLIPAVEPAHAPNAVTDRRPKASPSTRRQAAELGIDLATVMGSGPGGRILLSDLDSASATTPPTAASAPAGPPPVAAPSTAAPSATAPTPAAPAEASPSVTSLQADRAPAVAPGVTPLRGIRRVVAKNMAQSWSEIPHIHAFDHVDAYQLLDLRQRLRTTGGGSYADLTPLTFFVAAVARALTIHPQANASINMVDETITYHNQVNVGVAVATDQGLVVPVLQGAERLDFPTLSVTLAQLVRGARAGVLAREHFLGGTVTITNFGSLGGEQAAPLIRPPESLIVGFGSIAARPFVIEGNVVARDTMHTVVGADHRLLDGDVTTAVLTTIGSLLADPLQLIL